MKKQAGDFFDWQTFLIVILLLAAGLISIYSATYDAGMSSIFSRHLLFAALGFIGMFALIYVPERWIYANTYIIYGVTILLLVLVLFFGREVNGTKGWLPLGLFAIQPAEFAKLSVLLIVARHLSLKGSDVRTVRDMITITIMVALPAVLIALQPDHGTTTVLFAMLFGIMLWTGFNALLLYCIISIPVLLIMSLLGTVYYVIAVAVFAIGALFFKRKLLVTLLAVIIVSGIGLSGKLLVNKLAPYQRDRIETFINPGLNPKGKGYNVIQSILAVGSGGITGKGFLAGTQTQLRYIPEQWTDFIFSVPTEEFGFFGGSLVILLLILFILRAVRIAQETDSMFFSIIAFGIASIIFYHTFINIGMAIGLTPVMGIPLPFLSSGGSALMVNLTLVGLLLNAYRSFRKKNRE